MLERMVRLRGGTVGRRFTILYSAVFLASGVGLLVLVLAFSSVQITSTAPGPDRPPATTDVEADRIRELRAELAESAARQDRQLLVGSLVALTLMALASVLVGRALARRVLRPLRTITAATRDISAEDLDRRLAVTGPDDEVKDLADTIDGLLERLEASFRAQRRFVANASHELRTPLTTMRALLDVAAAKPDAPEPTTALADRLRAQLTEVDRLLDGLLTLARGQHDALDDTVPVDLNRLITGSLTEQAAAADAKRLAVTRIRPTAAIVEGDPALLGRLVDNLVDNAVVHNVDDGWLRVETMMDDGGVRLLVENGGPVLDPAGVAALGQPFRRLGDDRTGPGTGLGLSIVAAIATAHGGTLRLTARPEGGLAARVTLPAAGGDA